MSPDNLPKKRPSTTDINHFIDIGSKLPQRSTDKPICGGRLIFALDATASRQPSWDHACQLQGQMFMASDKLGGLQLQLCYYYGFHEFNHSPWLNDSHSLLGIMRNVQCAGGYTQLERVLDHSLTEHAAQPVHAVIIIGDAVEENIDKLCTKAAKLGMFGVPLFMFQEGFDPSVRQSFQHMARLSKGAYATFDDNSASELADLLSAVATFASGGYKALQRLHSTAARQLLQQLKK
ncbi:MAG: VWA domain-containing protein [Pseudomonadales bacterium]